MDALTTKSDAAIEQIKNIISMLDPDTINYICDLDNCPDISLEDKILYISYNIYLKSKRKKTHMLVGDVSEDLVKKLFSRHTHLIRTLLQKGSFIDPYNRMLRTIKSGGAFTSKIYLENNKLKIMPGVNVVELVEFSDLFLKIVKRLHSICSKTDRYCLFPFTVYRSINIGENIPEFIYQPIPFSTSWNYDLAIGSKNKEPWQKTRCCLIEINIPENYLYLLNFNPFDKTASFLNRFAFCSLLGPFEKGLMNNKK